LPTSRSIDPLALQPPALALLGRRINPLLARPHKARRVPRGATGNIISAVIAGDCCRPFLLDGDAAWFSPDITPCDGDLVQVAMRYAAARSRSLTQFGGDAPGIITRNSVKQLRIDENGQGWLVCADGRVEVDEHRIVGVLIGTARPPFWSLRRWRYPMRKAAWPSHCPVRGTTPATAPATADEARGPSGAA